MAASYDAADDAALRERCAGGQWDADAARCRRLDPIPLQIGGDSIYGEYFQGTIDEVRVYNTALTQAQIQADMNTPIGGTPPPPDLGITKTHAGNFTQGQTGATYSLAVSNAGTGPTSGTVTVTDTLPTGLTATAIAGTGWSCTLSTLTCTRSDALAAPSSYPAITLTVNVAANAPASVTNTATVSGGGDATPTNNTASDVTTYPRQDPRTLAISKTHAGNFTQGQTGATYSLAVSNAGTGPTSGTVTVTDTLPTGLTATAIAGTGWSCTLSTLTCTRSDALAAPSSYPAITLTVNVAANAPASVTNTATVSGGGDATPTNNTASDVTNDNPDRNPEPWHHEDPRRQLHAGADRGDLQPGRIQRGHRADQRLGDGDGHATDGPDGDGDKRHGLDLHPGDAHLHTEQRAGGELQLPGDHPDGERGCKRSRQRDQHGCGVGGRRHHAGQQHGQRCDDDIPGRISSASTHYLPAEQCPGE